MREGCAAATSAPTPPDAQWLYSWSRGCARRARLSGSEASNGGIDEMRAIVPYEQQLFGPQLSNESLAAQLRTGSRSRARQQLPSVPAAGRLPVPYRPARRPPRKQRSAIPSATEVSLIPPGPMMVIRRCRGNRRVSLTTASSRPINRDQTSRQVVRALGGCHPRRCSPGSSAIAIPVRGSPRSRLTSSATESPAQHADLNLRLPPATTVPGGARAISAACPCRRPRRGARPGQSEFSGAPCPDEQVHRLREGFVMPEGPSGLIETSVGPARRFSPALSTSG